MQGRDTIHVITTGEEEEGDIEMKEAPIEQATSKEGTAKADRKERDKEKRAEKEKIRSRNGSRSRSSSREGKLSSSFPPTVKTLTEFC